MNLDKSIAEMTLDDLSEYLHETFGDFIFYGANHDPSVAEEDSIIAINGGAYWKRAGLLNLIQTDLSTEEFGEHQAQDDE